MIRKVAVIWDFDGVIVFTPHEKAWRITCEKFGILNFTSEFYRNFVSGRPRLEGARNILRLLGGFEGRELEELAERFASEKNRVFWILVDKGEVEVNGPALDFIIRTREVASPVFEHILASASRNVATLSRRLEYRGRLISSYFDADVSGSGATKRDVFKKAAEVASSAGCYIAIDDAPSGINAAKELGFIPIGFGDGGLREWGARLIINEFAGLDPRGVLELCESR